MRAKTLVNECETKPFVVYDVSASVKAWGRRGIAWGGTIGFALGVAFVAIPFTSDVLTFGIVGTLIVATVEGAVIAGAFGAFAAALYGRGVLLGVRTEFDSSRTAAQSASRVQSRYVSASDWSMRQQYPDPAALRFNSETVEAEATTRQTLQDARLSLTTIDAWENGNTGP